MNLLQITGVELQLSYISNLLLLGKGGIKFMTYVSTELPIFYSLICDSYLHTGFGFFSICLSSK